MRAAGQSMAGAEIHSGDVLLVDRALTPQHGQIVIAKVEGELVCRRLVRQTGLVALETAEIPPGPCSRLLCNEVQPLEVWGVVTTVIRSLLNPMTTG